jgi:peroxiredoxin
MGVQEGDKIPAASFRLITPEGVKTISSEELCRGKKVVLFAVPGAFTPTCSAKHLPGFVEKADEICARGVDTIACVAVNDAFVMDAWGKANGVGDKITLLSDGNGEFARAMGLTLDGTGFGMGTRSQRYVAVIEDCVIKKLAVEAPSKFEVSSADAILKSL